MGVNAGRLAKYINRWKINGFRPHETAACNEPGLFMIQVACAISICTNSYQIYSESHDFNL